MGENAAGSHQVAYLPGIGEVKLRITGFGDDENKLKNEVEKLSDQLLPLVSEYTYGFGDDPLEAAIGKLLIEKKLTISVAESCTGGYLSHLITSVPGSFLLFFRKYGAVRLPNQNAPVGCSPRSSRAIRSSE